MIMMMIMMMMLMMMMMNDVHVDIPLLANYKKCNSSTIQARSNARVATVWNHWRRLKPIEADWSRLKSIEMIKMIKMIVES